ncbi:hypothetical protein DFS34DRAFT_223040 [Phlyctochytrium arcticum]|nr:hypothetical protein DFS34DRAFT_223040 [Phlyctochytrium arcticum]
MRDHPEHTALPSLAGTHPYSTFDEPLYEFLHTSPFTFNYDLPLSAATSRHIISTINKRLCDGAPESCKAIFGTDYVPSTPQKEDGPTSGSTGDGPSSAGERLSSEQEILPAEYQESQRGKACGHVFRKGEGVYRCRNCALDETCVFCSRCFHATSHDGHDTSFTIAAGSGGCCDCGDPEAWRIPLDCIYHSLANGETNQEMEPGEGNTATVPLPDNIVLSMRSTIATVLDFILDTVNDAPRDLTFPVTSPEIVELMNPADELSMGQEPSAAQRAKFACVLWNDETHSFQEVIDQVVAAIQVSKDDARSIAEFVDSHGRYVLSVSNQLSRMLEIGGIVQRIGLTVSIRTARETFREEVAGLAIEWLKGLANVAVGSKRVGDVTYEAADTLVRRLICEELCAPKRAMKQVMMQRLLMRVKFEDREPIKIPDENSISPEMLLANPTSPVPLRIEQLLVADTRLWKEARTSLRELYIGTMVVSGDEFKRLMGVRFAQNYLTIADDYLFHDREYDLSIINFSVQLFTVPTIAQYLMAHTQLLSTQFLLLKAFYLSDSLPSQYSLRDIRAAVRQASTDRRPHYPKLKCESDAAKNRRYWHLFQDVRYLLVTSGVKETIFRKDQELLHGFLDLCRVWQGMHPQQRYTRQHVEYESDHWLNAFNLSLQIGKQVKYAADCLSPIDNSEADLRALRKGLSATLAVLDMWCEAEHMNEIQQVIMQQGLAAGLGVNQNRRIPAPDGLHTVEIVEGRPYRVPFFRLASQPTSFHHPLHWFLSHLLSHLPRILSAINDANSTKDVLFSIFEDHNLSQPLGLPPADDMAPVSTDYNVSRVCLLMDFPLRVAVLLAQIRAGVWVRNGLNVRAQAMHYRENILRECYDQDLYLLQIYSILVKSDVFMSCLLDRFDLAAWFQGGVREAVTLTGLEAMQLTSMAEDLLHLLIVILTERSRIRGESPEEEMRREVIHHLAAHPQGLAYSDLAKRVPERLVDDCGVGLAEQTFENVLSQVATFKWPEGINENGVYELKSEFYSEVDPWFWHYTRNQREELETILRKRFEKGTENTAKYVRPPQVLPVPATSGHHLLGRVIKGEIFVRVLFYALWNTLGLPQDDIQDVPAVKSATLIEEAVHLIMLAIFCEGEEDKEGRPSTEERFTDLISSVQIRLPNPSAPIQSESSSSLTLLQFILKLTKRTNEEYLKDISGSMSWIVNRLKEVGGAETKRVIAEFEARSNEGGARPHVPEHGTSEEERQRKELAKAAAKARQAAIMQQFAEAQQKFMDNHADDMMDEDEDTEDMTLEQDGQHTTDAGFGNEGPSSGQQESTWQYPSGSCIFCQEETDDGEQQTFGLLGMIQPSQIERHIDLADAESIAGVIASPTSLDWNWDREEVSALSSSRSTPRGSVTNFTPISGSPSRSGLTPLPTVTPPAILSRPTLARPMSHDHFVAGLHISTCGHLMHLKCFKQYYNSVASRQAAQLTRNHPEQLDRSEYMCPLCKALGNCLIPVLWKTRKEQVNIIPKHVVEGGANLSEWQDWWIKQKSQWFDLRNADDTEMSSSSRMDSNEQTASGTESNQSSSLDLPEDSLERLQWHSFRLGPEGEPHDRTEWRGGHTGFVAVDALNQIDVWRDAHERFMPLLQQMFRGSDVDSEIMDYGVGGLEAMWFAFAYTVVANEIGGRGVDAKVPGQSAGADVLGTISPQALTLLRVMSDATMTYTRVKVQTPQINEKVRKMGVELFRSVFVGFVEMDEQLEARDIDDLSDMPPFLLIDSYSEFCQLCFTTIPACSAGGFEDVFRWCGIFFVNKVIHTICSILESVAIRNETWIKDPRVVDAADEAKKQQSSPEAEEQMRQFVIWICQNLDMQQKNIDLVLNTLDMGLVSVLVKRITLVFLRFLVITIWARFGIVPHEQPASSEPTVTTSNDSEYDRLSRYLRLPTLEILCSSKTIENPFFNRLIRGWCAHVAHDDQVFGGLSADGLPEAKLTPDEAEEGPIFALPDPRIRDLVAIPHRLDVLFEESLRRTCRRCGQVPSDPALCLICGTFVCSQSFCCQENDRGECNIHAKECGSGIGIYLLINKCVILLLHWDNGFFNTPPYLDAHGEVDFGLKRGRPQFLNQRRYDEIRKLWLTHGVPSFVARKIEQSFDRGGWQTM